MHHQLGSSFLLGTKYHCTLRSEGSELKGMSGFHFRGGGGSIKPPKTGGVVQEKGSIDRHH